jgi:hypothetical protein
LSLDIVAVASQVRQMGQDIASAQSDFTDRVRWARLLLQQHSERNRDVAATVRESKELRTARASLPLDEPLAFRRQAARCPNSYVAAAADGSQAEPDRHGHVNYFLINTGTALIRYGNEPAAGFATAPRLYYKHEDLHIIEQRQTDWKPDQQPREALIDGDILAMKRSVAEIEDLVRLAQNLPADLPSVLIVDGTLTLFAKSTGADAWVSELLVKQYQAALEAIHGMNLPVVGFISRSNASWVMEMLQVGVCGRERESCGFCRTRQPDKKAGCALVGLRDRFLYDGTLDEPGVPAPLHPGERSAIFQLSASLYKEYGWNEPAMFYMNSGREIAQVQVPMWVARDKALLDQVHTVIYEQCRNGGGYPTVLTRSHEQAVVTAADRDTLDQMVLSQLTNRGIHVPVSEKARSKQVRGI